MVVFLTRARLKVWFAVYGHDPDCWPIQKHGDVDENKLHQLTYDYWRNNVFEIFAQLPRASYAFVIDRTSTLGLRTLCFRYRKMNGFWKIPLLRDTLAEIADLGSNIKFLVYILKKKKKMHNTTLYIVLYMHGEWGWTPQNRYTYQILPVFCGLPLCNFHVITTSAYINLTSFSFGVSIFNFDGDCIKITVILTPGLGIQWLRFTLNIHNPSQHANRHVTYGPMLHSIPQTSLDFVTRNVAWLEKGRRLIKSTVLASCDLSIPATCPPSDKVCELRCANIRVCDTMPLLLCDSVSCVCDPTSLR